MNNIENICGIPIYESDLVPEDKLIALYKDPETFEIIGYVVNNIGALDTKSPIREVPRLDLCKHDDVKCRGCRFYEQCFLRKENLRDIKAIRRIKHENRL